MTELEQSLIVLIVGMCVLLLMYVLMRQYDRIQELEKEQKYLRRDVDGNAKVITEVIADCKGCK